MRSIRKRVLAIALSTRLLGAPGEERRKREYRELLSLTRRVMNQAKRVLAEVKQAPRRRRTPVEGLTQSLETMVGRVGQVVRQTRIRIFAGDTKSGEKIVSVFEPHTERRRRLFDDPCFAQVALKFQKIPTVDLRRRIASSALCIARISN